MRRGGGRPLNRKRKKFERVEFAFFRRFTADNRSPFFSTHSQHAVRRSHLLIHVMSTEAISRTHFKKINRRCRRKRGRDFRFSLYIPICRRVNAPGPPVVLSGRQNLYRHRHLAADSKRNPCAIANGVAAAATHRFQIITAFCRTKRDPTERTTE